MGKIITEITPLSPKDCFYLVERRKNEFNHPIHRHNEYELNFVCNCKGARRIVGDSIEELLDYDLVLVGPNLEHGWEHHHKEGNGVVREITIQFDSSLLGPGWLEKTQMTTLRELFEMSKTGVAFGMSAIMRLYAKMEELTNEKAGFLRLLKLLEILYLLSVTQEKRALSSTSFSNSKLTTDSRRVAKVEEFISQNYNKTLPLEQIASTVGMTPSAFSRFFKMRTGRTLSDYIIDIRIGHASRRLIDSTLTIAEICFECGFNNISNFNRLFKKKKGCTPKGFRDNYLKTRTIV